MTRNSDLVTAVEDSLRAPSVHNTQPWRFRADGETVTLCRDPALRLVFSTRLSPDDRDERGRFSVPRDLRPIRQRQVHVGVARQVHGVTAIPQRLGGPLRDREHEILLEETARRRRVIGGRISRRRTTTVTGVENDNSHDHPP